VATSLREQRKARTRADLAAAALELFAERGFAAVTMTDIAAAAGVGERTLYRYFSDKEELLFTEDEGLRAALRAAILDHPADARPSAALRAASATIAGWLQDHQDLVRRRAAVIAGAPALAARERVKHAAWEAVLVEAQLVRGVPAPEARLLARVTVACYDEALARWLSATDPGTTLPAELDRVFTELDRG
jgi:AcrR family transcriptional regulator